MKIFYEIKRNIKKILPNKILYNYQLYKSNKRKKKTFLQIESEINNQYKNIFKKSINWNNPKTYTEKLNVSKVYNPSKQKTELTDKIIVRKWIERKLGKEYLVPIIGVYKNFDDISFNELPSKFVIKCNHDSGSVTVVNDKKNLNIRQLKEKYDYHIKQNFSLIGFEMHYKDIEPKIIIEEYLGDNINDYKFLCFNGKVYYCWIDFDRFSDHKRNMYDIKWNLQPFNQCNYANSNEILKLKYEHCVSRHNAITRSVEYYIE